MNRDNRAAKKGAGGTENKLKVNGPSAVLLNGEKPLSICNNKKGLEELGEDCMSPSGDGVMA